ncbi:C_GCAxxG_C_C family protein [Candidatus Parcubacteria bacterium]|nr:C_GCAxxG_C_C family protein [Candidatus Parcubacteria bacterium]
MNINEEGKNNYLIKKFSCGEAVVKTAQERGVLNVSDDVIRVASSFKAGLGCKGDVCGCLLAVAALIGLKYGRTNGEEDDFLVNKKTAEFYDKFKAKFNELKCDCLTKKFKDKDAFMSAERKEFCAEIVGFAADELESDVFHKK